MEIEKKGNKVKIFMFLIFAIFTVVFVAQVIKIVNDSFKTIEKKTSEFKCSDLNIKLKSKSYKDENLLIELENNDYDTNISKLTIISDTSQEKVLQIEPPLTGGNSKFLLAQNISIKESFFIFAGDCENYKTKQPLK